MAPSSTPGTATEAPAADVSVASVVSSDTDAVSGATVGSEAPAWGATKRFIRTALRALISLLVTDIVVARVDFPRDGSLSKRGSSFNKHPLSAKKRGYNRTAMGL